MDSLKNIVREEVLYYDGKGAGLNCLTYAFIDEVRQHYGVIMVPYPYAEHKNLSIDPIIFVRVVDQCVVVESDHTYNPFHERLEKRGVPRDHIILAYQGEPIPEAAALQPWFDQVKTMRR
jgi:hypothetical protein